MSSSPLTEWDVLVNGNLRNIIRLSWDFPESNTHYTNVKAPNDTGSSRKFKVLKDTPEKTKEAANILYVYQTKLEEIIKNMKKNKHRANTKLEKEQMKLFLSIHEKRGHKICEINDKKNPNFSGMNKPYKIVLDRDAAKIGPKITNPKRELKGSAIEGDFASHIAENIPFLRPSYRTIFVTTKYPYDEDLLVHELAHTCANHVVFRPNDHYSDFYQAESFIKKFLK